MVELEKLRGTFIEGFPSFLQPQRQTALRRLHTGFKQHGTVTGRLSSSEPNLQQLPKGSTDPQAVRRWPGHVLIVADYDQIELRCAAYESRDPEMLRGLQARVRTFIAQAAAAMFQVALDDVTEDAASVGKTQNFAVLYGAGPAKIAFVAKCSLQRAEAVDTPVLRHLRWAGAVEGQAPGEGPQGRGLHRRRPPSARRHPSDRQVAPAPRPLRYKTTTARSAAAERQAVNARIQGFASNIAKMAMIDLHPKLQALPGPDARAGPRRGRDTGR